ncbi:MAG TPA: hypothetical protein VGQ83_06585 [Polyangia bacterium]|jgi:hypothetical protein
MIRKVAPPHAAETFADPTPLGLIGLAIGCAALTPIAFGACLTPMGLKTAAMFCLLFGGGCQFLAGMMSFANRNLYGGTLLTAFSFNWAMNWWALSSLAQGAVPDHSIVLATEVLSLVLFAVFTYGFGFFSKLLFAFLLDIDLLYAFKLLKALTGARWCDVPIALATVGLGAIALWIAFAMLINPTAGRQIFKVAGPLFKARPAAAPPVVDVAIRQAIADALYTHWRERAFVPMALVDLQGKVQARVGAKDLMPDLLYLKEMGGLAVTCADGAGSPITAARFTAAGIDAYEEAMLAS